jgi:hypothetical protein
MAELKRTFSSGVMNKDLDERLIPNGQYRDALNVQVSTSEGADVGSLQNILGNKIPYSQSIEANLGNYPYVLGSIRRDETECVYWFVTSQTKDLVIEYNQSTNTVSPILVDTNNVLGFTRNNLITGIEILDDFLFWTDNVSEPKMIKITDWRDKYANGSWNHTQVDGGNFEEKHCTVIKEGPKHAPNIRMYKTTRTGPITATLNPQPTIPATGYSFTYVDPSTGAWELVPVGPYIDQDGDGTADASSQIYPRPQESEIQFTGTAPDFRVGDKLKITLAEEEEADADPTAEIIVSVIETYDFAPKVFKINIDAVGENIARGVESWKVELIQKPPMFETKFVRFAYRYKYEDGQYSTISPFSEVAFIGDGYDYDFAKGYNLAMINQLRKLEIVDWARSDTPYGVVEVDILYKDSVSNNIYVVESISATDQQSEFYDVGSYPDIYFGKLEITSELIYKVIPSNQILRPYDNVPKKAKALAVSGNRLMFGNYTENYNLKKWESSIDDIKVDFSINVLSNEGVLKVPKKSLKSQRSYQIGVVYRDAYGRETPVLTSKSGSFKLNKGFAKTRNSILISINSPMPYWAEGYKYYIKETSQPYYNLAMDRSYPAEDGNLWISFSSSDRNKIDEETFLELKKVHDSDEFVEVDAKYKVIAIENEAPDFIKEENVSKGVLSSENTGSTLSFFSSLQGYPLSANKFIEVKADHWKKIFGGFGDELTTATPVHQLNNLNIIIFDTKSTTRRYEVASIQYFGHYATPAYRINLEKVFDSNDTSFMQSFTDEQSDPKLSLEVFQKETKAKPEYKGRFFAKLQRDLTLESSIVFDKTSDAEVRILASAQAFAMGSNNYEDDTYWKRATYKWDQDYYNALRANSVQSTGWFWDRHNMHSNKKSFGPLSDAGGKYGANGYGGMFPGGTHDQKTAWGAHAGNEYCTISWVGFGITNRVRTTLSEWEKTFRQTGESWHFPDQHAFYSSITKSGTKFRFSEDPNKEENVYTIKDWAVTYSIAYDNGRGKEKHQGIHSYERAIRVTMLLDKKLKWTPEDNGYTYSDISDIIRPTPRAGIEIVEDFYEEIGSTTSNPAVFETEPKEVAELDIYYEASGAYSADGHGQTNGLTYSNCFSFGNGVESDRIRDDFNAPIIGKGVRASTVLEDQYKEVTKKSDIIFSGIYNSTSGTNNLNQFIQAEQITKSINPSYGSIQLMQFRRGALDVYLEDNVVKILSDKDALFNADGSKNVISSTNVLGAIMPYAGDFGISKNPESYSRYGNRAYFSDKNRGVILRLSGDGLEPISRYGLEDYFRDKLANAGKVIGSYDENKKEYNITFTIIESHSTISSSEYNETVSFKEDVNGWNSRKSFIQDSGLSLNNIYYTFKNGEIWSHNNETRNNFYGTQYNSSVKFIFNDAPGSVKSFKTLNYEGSQARVYVDDPDTDNKFSNRLAKSGWWVDSIESDLQSGQVKTFKNKEGKWFYNILGTETTDLNLDTKEYSVQGLGYINNISDAEGRTIEIIVQ